MRLQTSAIYIMLVVRRLQGSWLGRVRPIKCLELNVLMAKHDVSKTTALCTGTQLAARAGLSTTNRGMFTSFSFDTQACGNGSATPTPFT